MAYLPISGVVPQYMDGSGDPYSGAVLKCYVAGTTTPLQMATDATGGTLVDDALLNASGHPTTSGNVFIPHLNTNYKLVLYPTQAAADANTGGIWSIDNLKLETLTWIKGADIASAAELLVNITGNMFDITGTTNITSLESRGGNDIIVLRFDDILVINHHATNLDLGGYNITTAAGDVGMFYEYAAGDYRLISWNGDYLNGLLTAAGDIVYASVANTPARLAVGERGSFLRAGASTPEYNSLPGYIDGLVLSLDTDTAHDVNITAGEAADSAGTTHLYLASEITKQIDATFAAGDDAGGMFTGAVAADTVYHLFLIRKDSDGTIDAGFDTDPNCANIPSGYTAYQYIGYCWTDGSSNILGLIGARNDGKPATLVKAIPTTSGTYTDIPYVPPWIKRVRANVVSYSVSGTANPAWQIGDSGGIEATGYLTSASLLGSTVSTTAYTSGWGIPTASAANVHHGVMDFVLHDPATFTWVGGGHMNLSNGTGQVTILLEGSKILSAALDRLRLTTFGGTDTHDSGSLSVTME